MRNFILLICSFLFTQTFFGQNAGSLYRTGDSLYKAKDYKNAAMTNGAGIRMEGKAAPISRYSLTALLWLLAKETDSVFQYLDLISQSDKVNRVEARNIENNAGFLLVKNDKRWQPAI